MGIFSKLLPAVGAIAGSLIPGVGTALGGAIGSGLSALTSSSDQPAFDNESGGFDQLGTQSGNSGNGIFGAIPGVVSDIGKAFAGSAPLLINSGVTAYAADSARAGQQETNAMNYNMFQQGLNFNYNAAEAASNANYNRMHEQMDFQETMSNTAWQRGVADMSKAGLNPMLAYSQGGASSPSGGFGGAPSASAGSAQPMVSPRSAGLQSALSAATVMSNIDRTQAETKLIESQVPKAAAEIELTQANIRRMEYELRVILPEQKAKLVSEVLSNNAGTNLKINEIQNQLAHLNLTKAELRQVIAALPKAENEARAYQEDALLRKVAPYLAPVGSAVSSGVGAARMFNMLRY